MSQTESSAAVLASAAGSNPEAEIDALIAQHSEETPATPSAPAASAAPAPTAAPAAAPEALDLDSVLRTYLQPAAAPAAPAAPQAPTAGAQPAEPPPAPPKSGGAKAMADYVKELREDGYDRIADTVEALVAQIPKGIDPAEVKKLVADAIAERDQAQQATTYERQIHGWFDKLTGMEAVFGKGQNVTPEQMAARRAAHDLTIPMLGAIKAAKAQGKDTSKITASQILERAAKAYATAIGHAPVAPASAAPARPRDTSGRFAPNAEPEKPVKDMAPHERAEYRDRENQRQTAAAASEIDSIIAKHSTVE